MSKIQWDNTGERRYETGVDHAVLYPQTANGYEEGVAWNGITSVTQSPSGAEATPLWADNIKYVELRSVEEFGGTVECFTYPDEFGECNGETKIVAGMRVGQQPRKPFGLCYRTLIGNDTELDEHGYTLHIVYGATCSPSQKQFSTKNDSPEAVTFSFEFTTTPVAFDGFKPTSYIEIDSTDFTTEAEKSKLTALEAILYGGENTDPRLPLPDEVASTLGYVKPVGE